LPALVFFLIVGRRDREGLAGGPFRYNTETSLESVIRTARRPNVQACNGSSRYRKTFKVSGQLKGGVAGFD